MSSTIEGSDDGDREDQLDLGQDDEELPLQPNGHTDHDRSGEDVNDALSHNGEPLSVTQNEAQKSPYVDLAPDGASDGVLSSQQGYPARAPGSVDGTASTPDDTPSLHVSYCRHRIDCSAVLTDRSRDHSARRLAVAHCRFEGTRASAPVRHIALSIYDSSPVSLLRH